MSNPIKTGKVITILRKARGLSQEQAAEGAGISLAYWRCMEHDYLNPTADIYRRIAQVLHVSPLVFPFLSCTDEQILSAICKPFPIPTGVKPLQIGNNILVFRKAQGLTQKELAKRAGVCAARLRDIEHGCANASMKTLDRIAEALGLSLLALASVGFTDEEVLEIVHKAKEVVENYNAKNAQKN